MPKKDKTTKKRVYKSPESRARQLAGLSGVKISDHVMGCDHIEKVNGKGIWASVSEEQRKQILKHYCAGKNIVEIAEMMGLSKTVVGDVKLRALDEDTQFANDMFKINFRKKLQRTATSALDRVEDLMPEMDARDAVLAFDRAAQLLMEMEAQQKPDIGSVNLHLHSSDNDLANQFLAAMGESARVIEAETLQDKPRPGVEPEAGQVLSVNPSAD